MKLEEIANKLNVSPQAVHKRIKNAIAKLRTFIEGPAHHTACALDKTFFSRPS